jgi:hypothetical protein
MSTRKERRAAAEKKRNDLVEEYTEFVKKYFDETKDLKATVEHLSDHVMGKCKGTPQEAALYNQVLTSFLKTLTDQLKVAVAESKESAE